MSKTITYTFGNNLGSINVVTGDNLQNVNTGNGTYPGYGVTSVSGTFNGQQVTGLTGAPGASQTFGSNYIDNTIFANSTEGYGGRSLYGFDNAGIFFGLANGTYVNVYEDGPGSNQLLAGISNSSFVTQNVIYAPVASSNYASVVCFDSGTLIRTSSGDVAVEDLRVGDLAVTASGEHRPIRWIGSRPTDCRRHPRANEVMPVRIRAGALGENKPTRDLVVSPGHAIALDVLGEVLIPASALVNGATIVQEDVESVTYWHVELDSHDLLIAEGQAAESYLDMGNRAFFAYSTSGATVVDLAAGPDGDPALRTHADFCRPFHMDGPLVDVARAQLRLRAERLGWALQDQELGDIHLLVDGARVRPRLRGASASFVVPEDAREVWLITSSGTGLQTVGSPDHRRLGLCVRGFEVKDSFDEPVRVAVEDPRLCVGFHRVERDAADIPYRWTGGRARLPVSLWQGLEGDVVLRVDAAGPVLPRWSAPTCADHAAVRTPARRDRSVAAAA